MNLFDGLKSTRSGTGKTIVEIVDCFEPRDRERRAEPHRGGGAGAGGPLGRASRGELTVAPAPPKPDQFATVHATLRRRLRSPGEDRRVVVISRRRTHAHNIRICPSSEPIERRHANGTGAITDRGPPPAGGARGSTAAATPPKNESPHRGGPCSGAGDRVLGTVSAKAPAGAPISLSIATGANARRRRAAPPAWARDGAQRFLADVHAYPTMIRRLGARRVTPLSQMRHLRSRSAVLRRCGPGGAAPAVPLGVASPRNARNRRDNVRTSSNSHSRTTSDPQPASGSSTACRASRSVAGDLRGPMLGVRRGT